MKSDSGIRHVPLQMKLDRLDELIDTLEREKVKAGDDDLTQDMEEARQMQQAARESYSRGEFGKAWRQTIQAEHSLFLGRKALDNRNRLIAAIDEALS